MNVWLALFFVQAHAQDQLRGTTMSSLAERFVDRALEGPRGAHDLDGAMLGKPGALRTPLQKGLARPLPRPLSSAPRSAQDSSLTGGESGPGLHATSQELGDAFESLEADVQRMAVDHKDLASANPEFLKRMKALSEDPSRMKALTEDPSMRPAFERMAQALKKGDMAAAMKTASDPMFMEDFLMKMSAADMNAEGVKEDEIGSLSLMDAARLKDKDALKVTKKLLAAGKDPNEADKDGYTPLMFAITTGNAKVVEALAGAGADTAIADDIGNTPLHYAAGTGRWPVIVALLDAGADPGARNAKGKTPGDIARNRAPDNPALLARLEAGR
jgi:hypothetical protein